MPSLNPIYAGKPASFPQRYRQLDEQVRRLRTRPKAGTGLPISETKTFIVGGSITTTVQVPPFIISSNPSVANAPDVDRTLSPEGKRVVGVAARLLDGTATVLFTKNGIGQVDVTATSAAPATWSPASFDLDDLDEIGITVTAANSNAINLAAAFCMIVTPMTMEFWLG